MKVSEAQIQAHTFAIQQARAALDAGVAPDSPQGEEIARRVAVRWSEATGILEGAELSAWLKERRGRRRSARGALLAAAGDHQRLAARARHVSRTRVAPRRPVTQRVRPRALRYPSWAGLAKLPPRHLM
jgi:hypothetical protein